MLLTRTVIDGDLGDAMTKTHSTLQATKDLMAALGRMPPKPHEDMKISKTSVKKVKSPGR